MTSSQPPRPRRKGGGQPGNRNALKHALYAKYFPEEMKKTFVKWETTDYIGEVQLLRASLDKMAFHTPSSKSLQQLPEIASMLQGDQLF